MQNPCVYSRQLEIHDDPKSQKFLLVFEMVVND